VKATFSPDFLFASKEEAIHLATVRFGKAIHPTFFPPVLLSVYREQDDTIVQTPRKYSRGNEPAINRLMSLWISYKLDWGRFIKTPFNPLLGRGRLIRDGFRRGNT
jgi:hypothetical protein